MGKVVEGRRNAQKTVVHPLALNSFVHWLRLLRRFGGIDRGAVVKAFVVTLISPLWSPFRLLERLVYGRRIERTVLEKDPIFIIGHWRSGTTLLHNLLTQDPRFGYVTLYQTIIPEANLITSGFLRPLVSFFTPRTRPMDNMALSVDLPQEEEFALCYLTTHSFYLGWFFPRRMKELFRKYVLFEGLSQGDLEEWRRVYVSVLKKAAFRAGGKQLILKNPANTGRIGALLALFPNAKFIHIYRDPYRVFMSTKWLHESVLGLIALQGIGEAEIEENVLLFYRQMMERYLADRDQIPPGNLVEVQYEVLEKRPLDELRRIYDAFALPGGDAAQELVSQYLSSEGEYKKNEFSMTPEDVAKVEEHWGFAFDAFGYERRTVPAAG